MKTTSFLTRLLSSSPVAPWPQPHSEFDQWYLTSGNYTSAASLTKALDIAIAAQKSVAAILPSRHEEDHDHHADATVELLDACNVAKQKIGAVRAYVKSLSIALHRLEGPHEPSHAALTRACAELDSCVATERRCKFGGRHRRVGPESGIGGARSVAVLAVAMVDIAVSFRTRQGVPSVTGSGKRRGGGVPVLEELAVTVSAARRLRGLVGSRDCQVELRRRCGELEERMRTLEERVDLLYRELIGVRMALLGSL